MGPSPYLHLDGVCGSKQGRSPQGPSRGSIVRVSEGRLLGPVRVQKPPRCRTVQMLPLSSQFRLAACTPLVAYLPLVAYADGWMDGCMHGWVDGRTDGWMDGWMGWLVG